MLRILKCNHSQGYLHWRPMPFGELEELLARQARASEPKPVQARLSAYPRQKR